MTNKLWHESELENWFYLTSKARRPAQKTIDFPYILITKKQKERKIACVACSLFSIDIFYEIIGKLEQKIALFQIPLDLFDLIKRNAHQQNV